MKANERLYAVIGGCVGAVLTLVVCAFFPLGAQSQRDTFGEITCTRLNVVGSDGSVKILLGVINEGGVINVFGEEANARPVVTIDAGDYGGQILTFSRKGGHISEMGVGKYGAHVRAESIGKGEVSMEVDEHGGRVDVHGKRKPVDGNGTVSIRLTEHGGKVSVHGKNSLVPRVVMGIDEYGHGTVFTRD